MAKILRGYSKDKNGALVIGTVQIPHSKDKPNPNERRDKRALIRRGATVFKEETTR